MKTFAHGVVGGLSSTLSGGSFSKAFLSTGVVQALSPGIGSVGFRGATANANVFARVGAAAVVGGIGARLVGGSFGESAYLGAFSRWFNDEHQSFGEKFRDALSSLKNSIKTNLMIGYKVGRAFGPGVSVEGSTNLGGKTIVNVEYIKEAEIEYGFTVSGTPYKEGNINEWYQGVELCVSGCVTVRWNYLGDWDISTRVTLPVAIGGGVISGYESTGRRIVDWWYIDGENN